MPLTLQTLNFCFKLGIRAFVAPSDLQASFEQYTNQSIFVSVPCFPPPNPVRARRTLHNEVVETDVPVQLRRLSGPSSSAPPRPQRMNSNKRYIYQGPNMHTPRGGRTESASFHLFAKAQHVPSYPARCTVGLRPSLAIRRGTTADMQDEGPCGRECVCSRHHHHRVSDR